MNKINEKAVSIIDEAEKQLRPLIAASASKGEYELTRRLSLAAEKLKTICSEMAGINITSFSANSNHLIIKYREKQKRGQLHTTSNRESKKDYPKFLRRNNSLFKIGWSKKKKQEYEHKVPREAYDQTVELLNEIAGADNKIITVEQFLEYLNSRTQIEIPVYQVYVTIALLRQHGLVEKCGREGYRVIDHNNLIELSRQIWDKIEAVK